MSAGDTAGMFLISHLKGIADYLLTARFRNQTTAKCHIMCKHMLYTSISVFNIFADDGDVYRNTRFAEYGIYTMQCLKHAVIGVGVPGLACGYVYTFYAFTFWRFHRAFKQNTQRFNRSLCIGCHTITVAF